MSPRVIAVNEHLDSLPSYEEFDEALFSWCFDVGSNPNPVRELVVSARTLVKATRGRFGSNEATYEAFLAAIRDDVAASAGARGEPGLGTRLRERVDGHDFEGDDRPTWFALSCFACLVASDPDTREFRERLGELLFRTHSDQTINNGELDLAWNRLQTWLEGRAAQESGYRRLELPGFGGNLVHLGTTYALAFPPRGELRRLVRLFASTGTTRETASFKSVVAVTQGNALDQMPRIMKERETFVSAWSDSQSVESLESLRFWSAVEYALEERDEQRSSGDVDDVSCTNILPRLVVRGGRTGDEFRAYVLVDREVAPPQLTEAFTNLDAVAFDHVFIGEFATGNRVERYGAGFEALLTGPPAALGAKGPAVETTSKANAIVFEKQGGEYVWTCLVRPEVSYHVVALSGGHTSEHLTEVGERPVAFWRNMILFSGVSGRKLSDMNIWDPPVRMAKLSMAGGLRHEGNLVGMPGMEYDVSAPDGVRLELVWGDRTDTLPRGVSLDGGRIRFDERVSGRATLVAMAQETGRPVARLRLSFLDDVFDPLDPWWPDESGRYVVSEAVDGDHVLTTPTDPGVFEEDGWLFPDVRVEEALSAYFEPFESSVPADDSHGMLETWLMLKATNKSSVGVRELADAARHFIGCTEAGGFDVARHLEESGHVHRIYDRWWPSIRLVGLRARFVLARNLATGTWRACLVGLQTPALRRALEARMTLDSHEHVTILPDSSGFERLYFESRMPLEVLDRLATLEGFVGIVARSTFLSPEGPPLPECVFEGTPQGYGAARREVWDPVRRRFVEDERSADEGELTRLSSEGAARWFEYRSASGTSWWTHSERAALWKVHSESDDVTSWFRVEDGWMFDAPVRVPLRTSRLALWCDPMASRHDVGKGSSLRFSDPSLVDVVSEGFASPFAHLPKRTFLPPGSLVWVVDRIGAMVLVVADHTVGHVHSVLPGHSWPNDPGLYVMPDEHGVAPSAESVEWLAIAEKLGQCGEIESDGRCVYVRGARRATAFRVYDGQGRLFVRRSLTLKSGEWNAFYELDETSEGVRWIEEWSMSEPVLGNAITLSSFEFVREGVNGNS